MSINKIVLFFLFISPITFSQAKKNSDTVFVYEKVFVYKTISKKIHFEGFDSIAKKRMAQTIPFKTDIVSDTSYLKRATASLKKDTKKENKKWFTIDRCGISIQSLFSQEPGTKNYGAGLGLFTTKNIYKNKLFLNFEFLFSKISGTIEIQKTGGYYITPDEVLFYKPKNANTQQLNLPITLAWKYKKIKPQIGIAYTRKQTDFDFIAYKNNTTHATSEKSSYKLTSNYVDFVYGAEYEINTRIGLFLKSKQTLVKIKNNNVPENLKSLEELHFFPNQVIFGVNYSLKK